MAADEKTVPAELAGPLDRAVRALWGVSWGKARAWIEAGKVRVAGSVVRDPTARVAAGAGLVMDQRAPRKEAPAGGSLDVVHADAHVIVVGKPPGVSTVPFVSERARTPSGHAGDGESDVDTLEARVRGWLESKAGTRGRGRPALGIVHRLDKETSGLVVFTRSWLAKQGLASQFRHHTVHRRYLAIAHGDVRPRTIRSFLMENRGDGLRGSARGTPPPSAREAITHVERIEALAGATLVGCRLETGRTHQIRIHLSESGHPIVGERVYVRGFAGPLIEAPRLMLHAAELGFVHPATEREMRWELPMPDDMRAVVERLRR
ncbi:MAG TPA: RluA family pseudouridine synthase [Polyangiaceae bacterium]